MNIGTYTLGARLDSLNYLEAQDALIDIIEKSSDVVLDMTDPVPDCACCSLQKRLPPPKV